MITSDHSKAIAWIAGALAVFTSGALQAAGHEGGAPVTTVSQEELEQLPANQRNISDLIKGLPDELVTTARRTEESTLDVPLSISTITGSELQAAQIQDLDGIAALTPGLSFQNYFGQDLSVPTIRGISQVDIFGDPNAPVYIDGIYVASQTGINFSFVDVARVEVLRGPQPAYFGYNAFSGAVNFVTRKPGDEFIMDAELTLGTDERQRLLGTIEGGLVEGVLAGRLSAMYDDFGGTYDNANPDVDQDIGGRKYKTLSAGLYFTPVDTFDAYLNVYLSDDSIDPDAQSSVPANCEPRITDGKLLNYCGNIPSVGKGDLATVPGETGQNREVFRTSLDMNWDVGFGTFSSLTGYSETKNEIVTSTDRGAGGANFSYRTTSANPAEFLGLWRAPFIQPSAGKDKFEEFSQEFRFSSPRDKQLRYTVGGYYRTTELDSPIPEGPGYWAPTSSVPADMATFLFGSFYSLCPGAPCDSPFVPNTVPTTGGFIFSGAITDMPPGLAYVDNASTDLWAGFAGLEYDFNDQWTGYIEARYTDFQQKDVDNSGPTPNETRFDDDFVNWRASIDYKPNELTTYYASIATGVKQGGLDSFSASLLNDFGGFDCPNDDECQVSGVEEYGSEEITTYELGYKALYNEGRTIVDAAVFYSEWDDIVLPQIRDEVNGEPTIEYSVSSNIGKALVAGGELSISHEFTDQFSGAFNTSYNRAKLDEGKIESFTLFPSFAPNGNMYGQTLSRQPELQFNVVGTYRDQFRGDWEWYTRGDVNYQSRWYVGLPNQARVPGRFRANARVGLESEAYTIEFWVTNLFDDDSVDAAFRDVYLSSCLPDGTCNSGTIFPFRLTVTHPERRAAGVTLRGRF